MNRGDRGGLLGRLSPSRCRSSSSISSSRFSRSMSRRMLRSRKAAISLATISLISTGMSDSSSSPLPGASQTNVTGRASFGYSRDNSSTLDATSPTSRSSLDFVFRSRTRTSMDPVSRAATVQAARQAFEEKEAAKNRKFEEQRMRAEEKQLKRREKQNQRTSVTGGDIQEKTLDYNPLEPAHRSHSTQSPTEPETWKSQSKSTWMLFLTWLRTRIFKFRRRVRSVS